jgi:hypothetical protein
MGAYQVWVKAKRTNDKREWVHIKYQVWARVKETNDKQKGDHHVCEWVHIKCV